MPKVNKLTPQERAAIVDKSPLSLPNNPTQSGFSAGQIKQKLSGMVTDSEDSVLAILDEKLEEIDDAFIDNDGDVSAIDSRLTTVEGKVSTLEGQNLNTRVTTAETDIDALEGRVTTEEGNVDNLQGRMTTAESNVTNLQSGKVDKTQTILFSDTSSGIDLQDNISLTEFKTALGNATQSLAGLMSAADKTNLDNLVAVLGVADGDNIVNTITEILAVFENYPEGFDLVNAFAGKVDKVAGKQLSTNDLTNTLKTNYDTAYNHSQIVTGNPHGTTVGDIGAEPANANIQAHVTLTDGTNPHQTTFANIQTKPTTIGGYGITDAYTKTQIDTSLSGKADIVDGKIPANQLPSFVDDVLEVYERAGATPTASDWFSLTSGGAAITPEAGKIYVIIAGALVNKTYRWSGTQYSIIGEMALGTTAATAFFGDRGLATETKTDNIVSGVQGLTNTRITNSAVDVVSLDVNAIASTTVGLQEWKINNIVQGRFTPSGNLASQGVFNLTSPSNSYVNTTTTGTVISRNVNDTNVALIVRKSLGTGNILELQTGTSDKKLEIDINGNVFKNGTRFIHNTGTNNLSVGNGSSNLSLTGQGNTIVGIQSLQALTTGNENIAIGLSVLGSNLVGGQNTIVGTYAGQSITGSSNTSLGYGSAISITTGQSNTFIGHNSGFNASQLANASNSTALGFGSFTDKSNQMVFGNASVSEILLSRNVSDIKVGVGIIAPTYGLEVFRNSDLTSTGSSTPLRLTGAGSTTNSYKEIAVLHHRTTATGLADGFGGFLRYTIEDSASGQIGIARIGAIRSGANTSGRLVFDTNNAGTLTEKMTILPNGNVGIGTSSPARLLSIVTSSNDDGIQIRRNSSDTNAYATLGFRIVGGGENAFNTSEIRGVLTNRTSFADTDLTFLTFTGSGSLTEKMRIRNDGNVGIGTNSPNYLLDVRGASDTRLNIANFVNTTNAGETEVAIRLGHTNNPPCDVFLVSKRMGPDAGADFSIELSDSDVGNNVERFRITETGNVGIGTTSPASKLQVQGTQAELSVRNDATNALVLGGFADGKHFIKSINLGTAFTPLSLQASSFSFENGNVGIGTSSPSVALEVNGLAKFDGTPSNAQTGDYTLVLADKGKVLRVNSSSNRTVTIPKNSVVAFPIDTEIAILRFGTGTVSISPTAGVTLESKAGERKISGQYGSVALKKILENTWVLVGSLEA